ncbi:MAG TPA: class I SAM-dependent methyltransferase [Tepidisphaeraceae bacterium]|jgi:ubiquinone/menaquinone biosynthesis C-methylase UbiE
MTATQKNPPQLKLLGKGEYVGVNSDDPIRFYRWPVIGSMYRRRVELCLGECTGGKSILEIGFGSGLTFTNLHDMYTEIHGLDLTADTSAVQSAFAKRGVQTDLRNGNILEMPYQDNQFDTVLLISILEHLKPQDQPRAFAEIRRVLKPGGQVVYGVPIERPLMVFMFRRLGYDIREHHFSTEKDVSAAAEQAMQKVRIIQMSSKPPIFGPVYEVGHFTKPIAP